ncbi:Uncharacterised protein [uncultured archaeon]|nr:Uncharacterised protein [uncultured archaeon]
MPFFRGKINKAVEASRAARVAGSSKPIDWGDIRKRQDTAFRNRKRIGILRGALAPKATLRLAGRKFLPARKEKMDLGRYHPLLKGIHPGDTVRITSIRGKVHLVKKVEFAGEKLIGAEGGRIMHYHLDKIQRIERIPPR